MMHIINFTFYNLCQCVYMCTQCGKRKTEICIKIRIVLANRVSVARLWSKRFEGELKLKTLYAE